MSALNTNLFFVFDEKIDSKTTKGENQTSPKSKNKVHFLFLNSNAPAKSIMIMPSAMAKEDFSGILANCKAKKPFTKMPSPIFLLVLNKISKNFSFIEKILARKSKCEKMFFHNLNQ